MIVTYNSAAEIGLCLDSLHDRADVVVVDNASSDASAAIAAERPGVRVLRNNENRGFAAAVNQGVRSCRAPLILILNPDTVVEKGLDELASVCERHGIAAGKLVDSEGRAQAGFTIRRFPTPAALAFESLGLNRLWPGNPVNRSYRYLDRDLAVEGWVEQPAGAFVMVRRDVFDRVGGFDESFAPVWFEDVDFLRRAAVLGFRAWYYPRALVRHKGGHSVGRITGEYRQLYWYASLLRYAEKHFRTLQFRAVCAAVAVGCLPRICVGTFGERGVIALNVGVARMAMSSLWSGRYCSAAREAAKKVAGSTSEDVVTQPVQR